MQRKARTSVAAGITTVALGALVVGVAGSVTDASRAPACPLPTFGPGADYHPQIDPANFSPNVNNPYFPLTPGTTLVYTGTKDDGNALDLTATTSRTAVMDGVTTRVVEDRLYIDNVLSERTSDYFAQDSCGNVWYFGEDTAELDAKGHVVSTEGSFHAGVDGAQPGVVMQAVPEVDREFRQEWYAGHAEDQFHVIRLKAPVKVPFGSFHDALRTEETTALEPDVVDNKYYVRGVGEVKEIAVKGATEELTLVEVIS
jgi:hypothetical protein